VEITEKTIPFYDKMVDKTKQNPTYIAVDAYDAVYVIKDAIERAGSLDTDAVLAALEKTDYRGAMGRIKFFPKNHEWPHDLVWGPGYVTWVDTQWRDGNLVTVWPDGKARLGMKDLEGLRYKGTVDYKLPPWMIEYWKNKK
jgi:branched-chain amino acid transport system substrate-binding protein